MTKQYMKNIVLEREALTPDQFQHVTDDALTSQSGYVYRYCPEEGRERDWRLLYDILLFTDVGQVVRNFQFKEDEKEYYWFSLEGIGVCVS